MLSQGSRKVKSVKPKLHRNRNLRIKFDVIIYALFVAKLVLVAFIACFCITLSVLGLKIIVNWIRKKLDGPKYWIYKVFPVQPIIILKQQWMQANMQQNWMHGLNADNAFPVKGYSINLCIQGFSSSYNYCNKAKIKAGIYVTKLHACIGCRQNLASIG